MRTRVLFLLPSLMLTSLPALAVKISGVEIPDTLTLANCGPELVLNGAGVRKKLFFDIYIGALYLPAKSGDARAILASPAPASIVMHFLYKKVSRKKITDAWTDGLADNLSAAEMQALHPRLKKFNALFRTMRKDGTIRLNYLPGKGTEVWINGEHRGTVRGEDFFHALLGIWLGAHPVSDSLKQHMLGLD
jgi:hypothetical protein